MVVGDVQISALLDALGDLGELDELLPATSDWEPYREAYPLAFSGSRFRFPVVSYLVRSGGRTLLVDTGGGPPGLWDWDSERAGELPAALAAQDLAPGDVNVVFFTHLHIDHAGWNTDDAGRPFFPNARYVVHREALAFARGEGRRDHTSRTIDPIEFEELNGEAEVMPGITAIPLPGHYPGHMGLRIQLGADGEAIVLGDAAAHPVLLDRPRDTFANDVDAGAAMETRERLLPQLVETDVLVLCGHYPDGGIGRVVQRDGRVLWTPV